MRRRDFLWAALAGTVAAFVGEMPGQLAGEVARHRERYRRSRLVCVYCRSYSPNHEPTCSAFIEMCRTSSRYKQEYEARTAAELANQVPH